MSIRLNFPALNGPLRVVRYKPRSMVLGPGTRAIVWFHGCSLSCPGCIAFEMNRSTTWLEFSPKELVAYLRTLPGIEGITLSGGDPFDQPKESLLAFLRHLRQETDLSVMCYTGRTLGQLERASDEAINRKILELCDILIDGVYDETRNTGQLWRGSSNQQIHFLTDRYRHLQEDAVNVRERAVEIDVSTDNVLTITGIPAPGFVERLRRQLDERGVTMRFQDNHSVPIPISTHDTVTRGVSS